jgi:hypothetical protein
MGLAGSACERVSVVTASARSLPALMYSIDAIGGDDEIGRKERQRYRHVDFAHAASRAIGDAAGRGSGVFDQLLEAKARLRSSLSRRAAAPV